MLAIPRPSSSSVGSRAEGPSSNCGSSSSPGQAPPFPSPSSPSPPSSSPPSLREILDAFSLNGSGDRELLLAILGAKKAEEERLATSLAFTTQQLLMLQAPVHFVHPFHGHPPVHHNNVAHNTSPTLNARSPSSSASSSASASPGPSTPPPSSLEPSSGPVRSAKLAAVRSKLLEKRKRQGASPTAAASPPPPARASTSPQPQAMPATSRRTVSPPRATSMDGLLALSSAAGVERRQQESFVRGSGSEGGSVDGEEDVQMEVRVKVEGQ